MDMVHIFRLVRYYTIQLFSSFYRNNKHQSSVVFIQL